jgi:hypothetical protein
MEENSLGKVRRFANCILFILLSYFLISLYNLLGHGLRSPFKILCGHFILPEIANRVFRFCLFEFAQFTLPYLPSRACCIARGRCVASRGIIQMAFFTPERL